MFALTEQVMNGTVTMQIITALIDKPTFEEAVHYFKEKYGNEAGIEIKLEDADNFAYVIPQKSDELFSVYGYIAKAPLKVL